METEKETFERVGSGWIVFLSTLLTLVFIFARPLLTTETEIYMYKFFMKLESRLPGEVLPVSELVTRGSNRTIGWRPPGRSRLTVGDLSVMHVFMYAFYHK